MKNIAIIFAGGVGSRMNSPEKPKQFLEWNGKAILIHTLLVFEQNNNIDGIILACKEDWIEYTKDLIYRENLKKVIDIVPGGETALESQYFALKRASEIFQKEKVAVLIHDGVRPLVDGKTIDRNIESVRTFGNAITVTPAIETVIMTKKNTIKNIMDRSTCYMAKAPQSFILEEILEAHRKSREKGTYSYIDSASLMLAHGYELHTVLGETENIKITTPSDYYMFLGISKARENSNE